MTTIATETHDILKSIATGETGAIEATSRSSARSSKETLGRALATTFANDVGEAGDTLEQKGGVKTGTGY